MAYRAPDIIGGLFHALPLRMKPSNWLLSRCDELAVNVKYASTCAGATHIIIEEIGAGHLFFSVMKHSQPTRFADCPRVCQVTGGSCEALRGSFRCNIALNAVAHVLRNF